MYFVELLSSAAERLLLQHPMTSGRRDRNSLSRDERTDAECTDALYHPALVGGPRRQRRHNTKGLWESSVALLTMVKIDGRAIIVTAVASTLSIPSKSARLASCLPFDGMPVGMWYCLYPKKLLLNGKASNFLRRCEEMQ